MGRVYKLRAEGTLQDDAASAVNGIRDIRNRPQLQLPHNPNFVGYFGSFSVVGVDVERLERVFKINLYASQETVDLHSENVDPRLHLALQAHWRLLPLT